METQDISDEEYFGAMKLMFLTDGWKYLTQDLLSDADRIGDVQDVTDFADLRYKQGQLATIGAFLNLEDIVKRGEQEGNDESP